MYTQLQTKFLNVFIDLYEIHYSPFRINVKIKNKTQTYTSLHFNEIGFNDADSNYA